MLAFLRLRRLPRRQTLTLWVPALGPWCSASFVAMWIGLTYALGYLYPRVTLVAVGVMLAVALAWLSARQAALRSAVEMQIDDQREVLAPQYDFFISYSRTPDNARWVAKTYMSCCEAASSDASGRPLRVFFDTEDIKAGASWYATPGDGNQQQQAFRCRIQRTTSAKVLPASKWSAAIRRVNQNDFIIPVLRENSSQVPAEFDHVQFVDARDDRDFIDQVLAQANASPPAEADPLQR